MQDEASRDAVHMSAVDINETAAQDLGRCWEELQHDSRGLIESKEHLVTLIREVLLFDIRSLNQRQRNDGDATVKDVAYHVHLAGIDLQYRVSGSTAQVVSAKYEPSTILSAAFQYLTINK
jgi:hypothetical protein